MKKLAAAVREYDMACKTFEAHWNNAFHNAYGFSPGEKAESKRLSQWRATCYATLVELARNELNINARYRPLTAS